MTLRGQFAQKKEAVIITSIRITQIAIDIFVIANKTGQFGVVLRRHQKKVTVSPGVTFPHVEESDVNQPHLTGAG